jgi:hypothetical protein
MLHVAAALAVPAALRRAILDCVELQFCSKAN